MSKKNCLIAHFSKNILYLVYFYPEQSAIWICRYDKKYQM